MHNNSDDSTTLQAELEEIQQAIAIYKAILEDLQSIKSQNSDLEDQIRRNEAEIKRLLLLNQWASSLNDCMNRVAKITPKLKRPRS